MKIYPLKGAALLRDIFENNREEFKEKYKDKLRKNIIDSIDAFLECGDFS